MAVVDSKSSVASSQSSAAAAAVAEQVPTYEEATSSRPPQPSNVPQNGMAKGSAQSIPSHQANTSASNETQRLYPFPSLGTERDGYGQSPYQPDGTLRIPIGSTSMNASGDPNLPFPASQSRRGPRAGRRFCAAFFWAVILYMCIISIYVGIDGNHIDHPTHPHPPHPPKGGPPGWHHHHGDKDEGKNHRHGDKKWFVKRSLALSSWQSQ